MRSGRKSEAQTPSPKKDRIKGSKVNPKGSASSAKSAKSIELSDSIITTLENKRDEYNKKHPNGKVTLGALKAVFRRGAGAFSSSHRPNMTRSGWAFARVNKFLLKKGGTKVKAAYVQDDDLMERGAILDSSCKTYISQNESILKTGYYLNLNEFSTMIDPYGQIPLNLNYTLVTYNSGNQDGLLLIDTINPINLQNELADILNIPLNNAQVVVGLYIEMGKKLKSISQIEGDNILVIDRDKLVCEIGKDNDLMEKGGLIAPNGNNSNLTLEQYNLVRTPEFKAWFGDWENDPENSSKVVDENGEPLVVYHATNNDFNEFRIVHKYIYQKINKNWSIGSHFGTYNQAKQIADEIPSFFIKPFFLNIKDLKRVYDYQTWTYKDWELNLIKLGYIKEGNYSFSKIYKILENEKFEGFVYENNYEGGGDSYIVLNPKSIKLADGTNTTFDGENPDIRYKDGGNLGQNIKCRRCGWDWNTNDSEEFDKYVCHNCGYDNRTFYDSDPIGEYHLGGDMSMHLAPNGKPSNLTHEQWHLVRTPEFKAWFGDWENDAENASKVVDENGEPMAVFHGTANVDYFDIKKNNGSIEFDTNRKSIAKRTSRGEIYFSTKYAVAEQFSNIKLLQDDEGTVEENQEGIVLTFFINIKNPKYIKANYMHIWDLTKIQLYAIKNSLNDGIIIEKVYDTLWGEEDSEYLSDVIIVHSSNQAKLADGSNTTFNGEKPDIRYEEGGIIDETYNKVLQGSMNSDDGAIFLDENGIEVTDDIYDILRNAEAESVKKSRGLQVGDIITVKGKYGNDDFQGNFRGYTEEGKLIVVYDGGKQMSISADEYYAEGGQLNQEPAFKKWFGNSKVVDKKGNPLKVYHGSPDLRGLKIDYIFKSRFEGNRSFFFTDNYTMAKSYADPRRAFDYQNAEEGIIGLYLSIQNPLIVDAHNQIWRKFETEINGEKISGTRSLIEYARNEHDGVIVKNVRDYYQDNEKKTSGGNVYVVFEPTQIKIADGTNTTFDSENPDIRYEEGGMPTENNIKIYTDMSTNEFMKYGGEISEENIIFYIEKNGNWFVPKNTVYAWMYENHEEAAAKLNSGEYDVVLFPPSPPISYALQKNYVPSLLRVWTKKFQKDVAGSEKLLGIVKAWYDEKNNKLYILMMTTRKDARRMGINSTMVRALRKKFNVEKDQVIFDKPTEMGEKFKDSGKYGGGGELMPRKNAFGTVGEDIWLLTRDEHNKENITVHSGDNSKRKKTPLESYFEKNVTNVIHKNKVREAIDNNRYEEAIKNGQMTRQRADEIIKSVFGDNSPYTSNYKEKGGDLPVGKLAKGMTEEEVAQIHGLHEKDIKNELLLGIEREMEHTDDPRYAKAIALDHLYENPKYYTKFKEMEKSFKEGGYFSDRYPKNEYIQLSNDDIYDFKEDIFNIINSSYAYIGGHIEFQKPDDIVNSDLNFWIGADIDEDPEVDTIIGGKKTNFGTKLTASAQDGSRDAKISVMKKMAELLKTKGFYAETNVDLALKRGTEWEKDENIIRKVVGKSDIVMNEDGSYTRSIGGHPHRKVLVGYFDHLKEKNYKRGGELDPDNKGVKDYFAGGSGSTGGVLVGKRHSEGGIKAINKATNTPIEMEGGEVVITRNAVSDNKKREFEGQMLTNKEILSKINVSGGGVSLYEDGGKVGCSFCTGKKYKYGGEMVSDYQIYDEVMRSGGDLALNNRYGSMSYQDANDIDDYNYDEQEIIYHFLRTDADYVYIDKDNVQNIKGLINKGLFNYRETDGNYNVEVYPTKLGKKLLNEMPVEAFKKGGNLPNRKKIIIGTNDSRSKRKKLEDYYASIQEDKKFASGGTIDGLEDLSGCSRSFLVDIKNSGLDYLDYSADRKNEVKELVDNDLIYFTDSSSLGCVTAFLTKKGKQFISSVPTHLFKKGGINDCGCGCGSYKDGGETDDDKNYFKGVSYDYENQFLVNKAIEELLNMKDSNDMTIDEKNFITYYSGYGGLEKYGASGKGLLYEYFTPSLIAKKMWGLAYKHGFEGGFVLEPSCGIGEFIKYAPEQEMVQGYEINETSAKICKILYPKANIKVEPFEKMFIKNNYTIKGQINGMNKYSLVIGNPPYGSMGGLYAGMGEKEYAKANNYIDYFILRGLDLLQSGGLLVFIIGVEVAAGGTPYLEQGITENKKLVSKIADLVDAYRLPNGVFERTDVLTDIVVFKKK